MRAVPLIFSALLSAKASALSRLKVSCLAVAVIAVSSGPLLATSVVKVPLATQIQESEIIALGRVKEVKMRGRFGLPVFDQSAQTGPGSSYSLWLLVEFDRRAVLKGDVDSVPQQKLLPVWTGWIKDLKGEKEVSLGRTFVFFLTKDFTPASVHFQHFEFERATIEEEIASQKK